MKISQQRALTTLSHPLLRTAILSAATFFFTFFSLELTRVGSELAPLWFPTAIMMVSCYRHPVRYWPMILTGCTLGTLLASILVAPVNSSTLLFCAVNIVEALTGAVLLRKLLPKYNPLQNLQDWGRLAFSSALVPPLVGGLLVTLLIPSPQPLQTLFIWLVSEAIGALALVPLGLLFKSHYLQRHRDPRILLETLATLIVTLALSALAMLWLPWPFTCIIVLLMWSAVRLRRLEAFAVFLLTIMMVSLMIATNPQILNSPHTFGLSNVAWIPFLMILLPVNIMTMVMYAFRLERKHITESELRFRHAMEYSAIGMALVSPDGRWLQVNKALCTFLGYQPHELLATSFQKLTFPDDLDNDMRQLDQLLRGDINTYSMEKRYCTRSGEVVWALMAVSLVRAADNSPLYLIAQIEDINDLKRSQAINSHLMERITMANEAGGIGIWEWMPDTNTIAWDKRMFELYEFSADMTPTWQRWSERVIDEDREYAEGVVNDALASRSSFTVEFRIRVKNGIRHIRSLGSLVLSPQGNVERLLGINMDMTEVKTLHEALFQEKERLHITLDSIADAVICTDVAMKVIFMNPVAEKMSGWTQSEALKQPLGELLHVTSDHQDPLTAGTDNEDAWETDIDEDVILHSRSGDRYDIHYSIRPLKTLDGERLGSVVVIQDVTDSRKMLRQLSYNASHDALTGLANRSSFETQLEDLLRVIARSRQQHALVFLDLDRFKAVNDTAGHAAGDALLQELAALMRRMVRPGDLLARLGGDEFGLLLPRCSLDDARAISERLVQAIKDHEFVRSGQRHLVGASAGIAVIDEHNTDASEIMSQADMACYASKHRGRGSVTVYAPPLADKASPLH